MAGQGFSVFLFQSSSYALRAEKLLAQKVQGKPSRSPGLELRLRVCSDRPHRQEKAGGNGEKTSV